MSVTLQLFGAFREFAADGRVELAIERPATVAALRAALDAHARAHWPGYRPPLLAVSAFASESEVLRDGDPLPDGELAVLPPVSGG
jgi:sulfur-carrier protein